MATYTSNYGWTKPSGSDNVDISVLNNNLDDQDSTIHDAFLNMAPPFSESSTYAVDDIVLYGTGLYKCHTAVVTPGSWTGTTNWQVYKLSEGGSGGGGTSDYLDLTNKPQINNVELSGNKTTGDLGLQDKMQYSTMPTASADNVGKIYQYVGTADANYTNGYYYKCVENSGSYSWQLVENIEEQTPTFSQASTRNNIASGEKLSVILGKIAKFFDDLKTVAFSGSYTDLTNQPQINSNTLSGNKTTSDLGINADNVMMSDGVTSVEDRISANDYNGSAVQITTYTDPTNPYIVPLDGYIRFAMCEIRLLNADGTKNVGLGYSQNSSITSIFVRKGSKIYLQNIGTGTTAYWIGLV